MSELDKQTGPRVAFETPVSARIMAIDGTWQRACKIHDVSETGAKLVIDGSINDLGQREFFLVLSSTGLAYRHCELAWVNGEFVGVQFLNRGRAEKRARRGETLVH
ncbi:PilZ domain-containing protein [Bradyrhizobium sp.]|uniref:PilZ domain-containing protein n=1 Tax=Bradyrhizobium sp. TaxID=376 RepID=UPI002398238B|nr:PilZ domain-containing protein [Bradyrhizobium sp.]MDE2377217.1 PilZ domain-containing protein [Bradyrhizobium sp.]